MSGHRLGVAGAAMFAIALVLGILLGNGHQLPFGINTGQDIRTICLALWAVVVPGWWTFEEQVWPPPPAGPEKDQFERDQRSARAVWLMVGIVVCIVAGVTPPKPVS